MTRMAQPTATVPETATTSEAVQVRSLRGVRAREAVMVVLSGSLLILFFLAVWQILVWTGRLNPLVFSSPLQVAEQIWEWASGGAIADDIYVTVKEVAIGYPIGVAAALILALMTHFMKTFDEFLAPMLNMFNSVPRIIFAPILLLIFGLGIASKVALVTLMSFLLVYYTVREGLAAVDHHLDENVRQLGGTFLDALRHVYVPAAFVWIMSSLRLAIGFAFIGAVVAEYVGSNKGLGYLIVIGEAKGSVTEVVAGVVIIVAFVGAVNAVLGLVERRYARWRTA